VKFIGPLTLIMAAGFPWPCNAEDASAEKTNRLPTATEVFHLRSECAALGRKILDGNFVGPAVQETQVSHYDPKSNRCYVLLTLQPADLTKASYRIDNYLYDGQTGEMLAALHYKGEDKKAGIVYDVQHEPTTITNGYYDDTKAYIEGLMDEGHR
jgi:hypothetical protein